MLRLHPFGIYILSIIGSLSTPRSGLFAQRDSTRRIVVGPVVRQEVSTSLDSVRLRDVVVQRGERPAGPDQGLEQFVFPPDRVMQYQERIGLSSGQRNAVRTAVREMQSKTLELQWRLQDESEKLIELLKRPTVSETEALGQVDRVLTVEREVKRAQMGMLIKIKNGLTAEQQQTLREIREFDSRSGRPWDNDDSGFPHSRE